MRISTPFAARRAVVNRSVASGAVVIGLVATTCLAGCSSSTPANSSAQSQAKIVSAALSVEAAYGSSGASGLYVGKKVPDPCTLVTDADVTTAFGTALTPKTPTTVSTDARKCQWGTDTEYLKITVYGNTHTFKMSQAENTQTLSGPWDQGAYSTSVLGTSLSYLKDGMSVMIQLFDTQSAGPDLAHATALAEVTAAKLK